MRTDRSNGSRRTSGVTAGVIVGAMEPGSPATTVDSDKREPKFCVGTDPSRIRDRTYVPEHLGDHAR